MANTTIQLKRSSVAGKTPNTSTLSTGELAINLTDKKLYSSDGTNIFEPAGNVTNINITGGIKANGSFGTNGYTLSTNGSGIYWAPAASGGSTVNTTPSNIKNIVNTSVSTTQTVVDTINATGISTVEYLISARDNTNSNYKSARVLITTNGTTSFVTEYGIVLSNNSAQVCSFDSDINAGNIRLLATGDSIDVDVSLQRVVLGSATEAGDIAASVIVDSVTNTAINVSAAANSVKLAYDTAISAYSNAVSYTDTKIGTANTAMEANAATAYTNAVSYTDSRIIDSVTNTSITYAASANSVKNAYDRAIDANTRASSAQTAATSAYSNAVSYVDTKIGTANTAITGNAATAYTNAVSYTDSRIIDSVTNTSVTYAASANSVKNAYDRAIDANTRASSAQSAAASAYSNGVTYSDTIAGTAYTNATIFAANISNVNSGTLSEARLPYRMNQNVQTTDNITFNDLTVTGNLTLSGNTLIVGANNLIVSDAVISLHTPANLAALTSNDGRNIGLAFHYYDTEDKHALLYRDNTTGYLQYHTDGGDPISNSNPTGNNFGTIQAATFWAGNSSIYATVNATNYTGTSNNASYLNGQLPAYYTNATNITTGTLPYAQIPVNVINTTADFTRTGITTFSANVVLGSSGLSSNGSFGTAGQILASNGTATYWSSTLAPRVNTATSTTTLNWNSDNYEQYQLTALSSICTISADSGTPVNGRKIIFRLEDNGNARALTWTNGVSNSFRAIGTTLPTATVANKTVYVGAIYNSTDSRWDVIAVAQEA